MKKFIVLAVLLTALSAKAQVGAGEVPTTIFDYTDGTVLYIGTALTVASETTTFPSTNAAIWAITKIEKTDGKVTGIYEAVTTARGDVSKRKNIWALRAATNTIYKVAN
jgi:opacity protein-like surface antigen